MRWTRECASMILSALVYMGELEYTSVQVSLDIVVSGRSGALVSMGEAEYNKAFR